MRRAIALLFLAVSMNANAENPSVRMATEGRLQLSVPENVGKLGDVWIGRCSAAPGAGMKREKNDGKRTADLSFPAHWWRWTPVEIEFTPDFTGQVELSLSGPWEEDGTGGEFRQEVLWDGFCAEGTRVVNPGFERSGGAAAPEGWESPWSPYPGGDAWPLAGAEAAEGKRCAASWHGRPLVQKIPVETGRTVKLKMLVRAATPPGFRAPKPLGSDTPAHRACGRMKRGVNLGNCWEASPGSPTVEFTPADIDRIAGEGFDHIRVPVSWQFWLEGGKISPRLLADLEPVLRRALERHLTVILNWHHFPEFDKHPERHRKQFLDGWRVIARHFSSWPPALILEVLNEPTENLSGDLLNDIQAEAIAVVRESNPKRTLLADPGHWASAFGLDTFRLPEDDANIIVGVHCYEPFLLTHQGAKWVDLEDLTGIVYPGPPGKPLAVPRSLRGEPNRVFWLEAYNRRPTEKNPCSARAFEVMLDLAVEWSKRFGRPVHIGEFGAFQTTVPVSRVRFARDYRKAAEQRRLPWCWWEWKAGFGYWDPEAGKPLLRKALME